MAVENDGPDVVVDQLLDALCVGMDDRTAGYRMLIEIVREDPRIGFVVSNALIEMLNASRTGGPFTHFETIGPDGTVVNPEDFPQDAGATLGARMLCAPDVDERLILWDAASPAVAPYAVVFLYSTSVHQWCEIRAKDQARKN